MNVMEGERDNQALGGRAVEEPFFTEEAEEVARPVVPLRQAEAVGPTSEQPRGRLPQSLKLSLALILAGAVGVGAGYFIFRGRAPQPTSQESAETALESPAPQPTVDESINTPAARKVETQIKVEPERPATNAAAARPRDGGEERVEHRREQTVHEESDEARPRREEAAARAESRRGTDEGQAVPRHEERRAVRRDGTQDGKPKARLVGTITGRPRRY